MNNERTEMLVMDRAVDTMTTVSARAAVKATNAVGRLMTKSCILQCLWQCPALL